MVGDLFTIHNSRSTIHNFVPPSFQHTFYVIPTTYPTPVKSGMISLMRHYWPLVLTLVVYFGIGSLFASQVPAWQAPDEPAHYNYVAQLANGRFPIIEAGDYDQSYLDEIRGAQFAPNYETESIEYEDWQPPLYYLLLTPVFWLTNGSLLALRLTSLLLGAGVVTLGYLIGQELFPKSPWVPLTTAVFIAFLPQHLSILASINNDSLAELLIAALLYTLFVWTREPIDNQPRNHYFLVTSGILLGLGMLTKLTVYLMVPVAGVFLLWRFWRKWNDLFYALVLFFGPVVLLGSLWWIRNLLVYPGFDPLAMAAHDRVVVGQPRTVEWIAQFGLSGTIQRFLQTTFNSFWGQFGWMAVPMPTWVYQPLLIFSILILLGLGGRFVQSRRRKLPLMPTAVLLLVLLLTLSVHVYYNLTFVQHQGRYLFPALVPIGIGVGVGLEAWSGWLRQLLRQRWETAVNILIPLGLAIALATLNLIALYKFILPAFS